MVRTLPWLKERPKNEAASVRSKTVKTPNPQDLDSEDDAASTTGVSPFKRKAIARAEQRTPSTSPPPSPPTEEFMRSGLSHDDIYIMVEDEFQAVAQTFTQHLHHAEYTRLKNIAKSRTTSALNTTTRPTDSVTAMRIETRKKKEAEVREAKQKSALQQMTKAPIPDNKSDSDSDNKLDASWAGTVLQTLMTSPRKHRTSLTGLHGVKSSTRAAAGFSKPEIRVVPAKATRPFDPTPRNVKQRPPEGEEGEKDGATTSGSDDDLGALPTKPALKRPCPSNVIAKPLATKPSFLPHPSELIVKAPLRSRASKPHPPKPPIPSIPTVTPTPATLRMLKARQARHSKQPTQKPASVDEIPTFLI